MTNLFPRSAVPIRDLRDYQSDAIERLRDSLRSGNKRPMLQAPTGAGKTRLAGEIFRLARQKDSRVVFCVPRIDLVDQTLESFWSDGVGDIGVIQADHVETDWSRPVQIASVQTLQRRGFPAAQLVMVDEAHMAFRFIHEWMAHPDWQKVPFIGLSATPWTKGLGKHYDDLIVSTTTAQLMGRGLLSQFRVFAPAHPDLSGVKVRMGDYVEGELSKAMNQSPLVADVVETWLTRGENRPTLCFAVDRAHAKALRERFERAAISVGYQDAHTPKDERAEIRRKFHNGDYKVVCNIGTLTTGVDWDVRCIILARPTRSEILYVQMIGRGLRPKAGDPQDCLILDHSDTTLRLGFVTDIHHEELDDGSGREKRKREAPLPKECSKCAYLMPPRTPQCPNCGHVRQAPPGLRHEKGELVELSATGAEKVVKSGGMRHVELRGKKIPLREFFAELKGYGQTHGYKPGWAAQKYRSLVGTWPAHSDKHVEPIPPRYETLSWIKAQAIAWAKRSERHAR